MQISIACLAAIFFGLTLSHPVEKRANSLPPVDSSQDESVAQLALYLEHLEFVLYSGGFDNFTDAEYAAAGFPSGFRNNVGVIAQQEQTHANTLATILTRAGRQPVPPCEYRFPYNSPTSFVDLANSITSVGIGAYLGGGSQLTDDPALLTAASSILTTEARHDAYLRAGVGGSPFPTPFDTSLTAEFAFNLAQNFIVRCPQQLPIRILPRLTLRSPSPPPNLQPPTAAGTPLQFTYDPSTFSTQPRPGTPLYIGLINSATNVTYTETTSCGQNCAQIPAPQGAGGAAFAVLTNYGPDASLTEDALSQSGALAGPAEVILS